MPTPADQSRRFPTRGRPLVAFVDGWNRAIHAPAVTIGLLLMSALWAGLLLAQGPVLEAFNAADGFSRQLVSGHTLFVNYVLGLLGPTMNGRAVAAVIGCVVTGIFLSGGILDRLARARPVGSAAFFSACGGYAGRLLRLSAPFLLIDWFLLRPDAHLYFDGPYGSLAILILLAAVTLVQDFAQVRLVVEDRRSAIGAIVASIRFIRRRFWRVSALYLINLAALAGVLQAFMSYGGVARDSAWGAPLVGWLGELLGAWIFLSCAGSEIAFFQAELAHAGYSARPLPVWPDSPSAEGLRNLVPPPGPRP